MSYDAALENYKLRKALEFQFALTIGLLNDGDYDELPEKYVDFSLYLTENLPTDSTILDKLEESYNLLKGTV